MTIPGAKVLLMGATGTGKTYAIESFRDSGVKPFVIFTEPGMRTISHLPQDEVHWMYVPPASPGWDTMIANAEKINNLSFQALTGMKDGMNKQHYGQFIQLLHAFTNFKCDRTGEEFGPVDEWGTDRCLYIDSLSGINIMAMDLVAGAKPVKAMGEWGVAMDNLERLLNQLTTSLNCHMVLTAHLDREMDEVSGGTTITAQVLGRKLAPRVPRFFDDVILAYREDTRFFWSTAQTGVDLKARNLPLSGKLNPSFKDLIESWKEAGGEIQAAEQSNSAA